MNAFVTQFVDFLVTFATDWLLPSMALVFVLGVASRVLINFTIKREEWFAKEFEKRVHSYLENNKHEKSQKSFYVICKLLLEKTFYEVFEVRAIMKRRRPDIVMSFTDRLFLIQHGVAILVRDTLKHVRYLNKNGDHPKFLEISKTVFQSNPCFRKLFAIIPSGGINDILNVLPGLFIVMGIFGTFLGIMNALPELGGMDLTNAELTKQTMDDFLIRISFSMSTSILGIIFSVLMILTNTIFSPEKTFVNIIEKFESNLDILWNHSENNDLEALEDGSYVLSPVEQLAEKSLDNQINELNEKIKPRSDKYNTDKTVEESK